LSFCACSASAQESDTNVQSNNEVVDEVVIKGVNRCGPWPIQHQDLSGCQYPELKSEDLRAVLDLRQELFGTCLNCQGNTCRGKAWRDDQLKEELVCKRNFWTARKISKTAYFGERISPLRVSFTFRISTKGRVKDIEIVSFAGDFTEATLLRLIKDGASKTRFEPLVIADIAYEIVGLRDSYVLDN